MKRVIYISAAFLGISMLFGVCYYLSFKNALLHYNREAVEQNTELLQQLLAYSGKSEQLLYEKKVAIVPGPAFGQGGEGFVRASYCYSTEHIQEALRRIGQFLDERGLHK